MEGDAPTVVLWYIALLFLSTPSGWRATVPLDHTIATTNISIHALRVEGDYRAAIVPPMLRISIHALRVEGDGLG